MARSSSGEYNFQPAVAEFIVEAYERIGIAGPALTDSRYVISARRSANFILTDWANRGFNLWAIGDELLVVPLLPGKREYKLPRNLVDLADCYLRTYTPNSTAQNIGQALTPVLMNGRPAVTGAGDPMVLGPGSGTLSCKSGSQYVTLNWRGHCLTPGDPIFWGTPVSVGGLMMEGFSIVDSVIDVDHVSFLAPDAAAITSAGMGATPLYAVGIATPLVGCILPNHGLCVGDSWTVHFPVTLGGIEVSPNNFQGALTIPAGTYTVEYVAPNGYEFYFNPTAFPTVFITNDLGQIITDDNGEPIVQPTGGAAAADAKFENNGFLSVTSQKPGLLPNDIYLWPLSRNEYAMLPEKNIPGRPTQYWFNRTIVPSIAIWPVPATPNLNASVVSALNSTTPAPGPFYGFLAYRMRTIQDADPVDGQAPDIPTRFYQAFVAELAAALAEKYKPERFQEKAMLASMAWDRASNADSERVSVYMTPQFQGFFG